jgi:hypothetical protein
MHVRFRGEDTWIEVAVPEWPGKDNLQAHQADQDWEAHQRKLEQIWQAYLRQLEEAQTAYERSLFMERA